MVGAAHAGKVNAVFCLHDHNVLITGGDDGFVAFWKASDVTPLHKVKIESAGAGAGAGAGRSGGQAVSSITTDSKSKALVGTKGGEIWEISDQARPLVQAHGKGELWVGPNTEE